MVGVIRTYGQEPPHCYNAQVSVQMTNALRTNLPKLSTSLQSQRYGAWWRSLYKHTGRSVHIMHAIVCGTGYYYIAGQIANDQCTWNKFF